MRYPDIKIFVDVHGESGNAFFVIAQAVAKMKVEGVSASEIELFKKTATSSDYENVLATVRDWFDATIIRDDSNESEEN